MLREVQDYITPLSCKLYLYNVHLSALYIYTTSTSLLCISIHRPHLCSVYLYTVHISALYIYTPSTSLFCISIQLPHLCSVYLYTVHISALYIYTTSTSLLCISIHRPHLCSVYLYTVHISALYIYIVLYCIYWHKLWLHVENKQSPQPCRILHLCPVALQIPIFVQGLLYYVT